MSKIKKDLPEFVSHEIKLDHDYKFVKKVFSIFFNKYIDIFKCEKCANKIFIDNPNVFALTGTDFEISKFRYKNLDSTFVSGKYIKLPAYANLPDYANKVIKLSIETDDNWCTAHQCKEVKNDLPEEIKLDHNYEFIEKKCFYRWVIMFQCKTCSQKIFIDGNNIFALLSDNAKEIYNNNLGSSGLKNFEKLPAYNNYLNCNDYMIKYIIE